MKKLVLSLFVLFSLSVMAQEYDVNYALASAGASATASSGNAGSAIDGNIDSRWESAGTDTEWWLLDLGQTRSFDMIKIAWEGAYTADFRIEASTDGTAYSTILTVTGQKLVNGQFKTYIVYGVPETSARYVKFQAVKRGTNYGNSFYEFQVLHGAPAVVQKIQLSLPSNICKLDETLAVTTQAVDQYGRGMAVDPAYTVVPADAGTIANGVFTPAHTGTAKIIAVSGEYSDTAVVAVYGGNNLALNRMKEENGHYENNDASKAVDGNMGSQWNAHAGTGGSEAERTYDSWFTVDLGAFYNIDLVTIAFEGARSEIYHVDMSSDYQTWTTFYTGGHTGTANVTDYIYGTIAASAEVRYLRFWSERASSGYGMKIYEFQAFGTIIPDTQAPSILGAALVDSSYNSLTFKLNVQDNLFVAKAEVVDAGNYINKKVALEEDSTIVVSGLVANRQYNFTIRAIDGAGNFSQESVTASGKTTLRYTKPTTAAPVPDVPAAQVISVYSDAYTENPLWDSYHAAWGDATTFSEEKIAGDNYLLYGNLNWLGWTAVSPVNATVMEYLHIDIWSEKAGSIGIVPIYGGEGLTTNDGHRYTAKLKAQQWNSFDINLSQDLNGLDLSSIFQFKFDSNVGLGAFAIDNAYFYRTTAYEDSVAPSELTAVAKNISYHNLTLSISAKDNGAVVNFVVLDGKKQIAALSAKSGATVDVKVDGLKMGTDYTYAVVASDYVGNLSDTVLVAATTLGAPNPGPAPTPLQESAYVQSLYSNHFNAYTYFWAGNWYQKTQVQDLVVAPGDTALFFTEFDYLGWEINNNVPFNVSKNSYLHIDVYAVDNSNVTILPISSGLADNAPGYLLELTKDEWNSFDILLDEFPTDFKKFLQMKFYDGTAKAFVVDNVYFWGYENTAISNTEAEAQVSKVLRNGNIYIIRDGQTYTVTGVRVE